MEPAKSLVERLGYGAGERLLIINCDDVGSSHAANLACHEAMTAGVATSGTLMVPCAWAREAVDMFAGLDLGVHLTLTAEYPGYRWRSLTGGRSLHDSDGFLQLEIEDLQEMRVHQLFINEPGSLEELIDPRGGADTPQAVGKLSILDIIPTADVWRLADRRFALGYWHWSFLAQAHPFPEHFIAADPVHFAFRIAQGATYFEPAADADYVAALAFCN